ncbi:hypothetical protein RLW55_06205 [Hyphomicrobium sp. B1]|uniref:hypothetical protein n=1 Tax=Hyphomicrobium sp. B1 TaxID=3075651 RepID=UPI003C2BD101
MSVLLIVGSSDLQVEGEDQKVAQEASHIFDIAQQFCASAFQIAQLLLALAEHMRQRPQLFGGGGEFPRRFSNGFAVKKGTQLLEVFELLTDQRDGGFEYRSRAREFPLDLASRSFQMA